MTDIFAFCGAGLCAFFALSIVRELRKEYAAALMIAFCAVFLMYVIPRAMESVDFIKEASVRMNSVYASVLLRSLGVTYLTSISGDICRASGEGTVAGYIEGAGRVELLLLAVPLMRELLSLELY